MANLLFAERSFQLDWKIPGLGQYADYIKANGAGSRRVYSSYNVPTAPLGGSISPRLSTPRYSRLHRPTVQAIETLYAMVAKKDLPPWYTSFALGQQENRDTGGILYYCYEAVLADGTARFGVYNPHTGEFRMGMEKQAGIIKALPPLGSADNSGVELLVLMAWFSYLKNKEFQTKFDRYYDLLPSASTMVGDMDDMLIMCDNLFQRITVGKADRIPCVISETGEIPGLLASKIPECSPNKVVYTQGEGFRLLNGKARKKPGVKLPRTMAAAKTFFNLGLEIAKEEVGRIPQMPASYQLTSEVMEMAYMVKFGKDRQEGRNFFCRGESGTGKTSDAQALAELLGVPYLCFTCSEKTDEVSLLLSFIPDEGGQKINGLSIPSNIPSLHDFKMDPAGAMEGFTGQYDEAMDADKAVSILLKALTLKQASQRFKAVESAVVKAAQMPCVCEIQEPSCISKPATLVALNSLLDAGAQVTLMDGRVVHRNPYTVYVLTSNVNYAGCRPMNESILSRMNEIIDYAPPTAKMMAARVEKKFGIDANAYDMVEAMAKTITALQAYCRSEMITGGVCGMREYENWVERYLLYPDSSPAASCRYTVLSKISSDVEIQNELMKSVVHPAFGE